MPITVGICDDQASHIDLMEHCLTQYEGNQSFGVFQATGPVEFLPLVRERKPQLVFLDIDMPGMNGIELGERIREEFPGTVIIYITAHEHYALQAFRVRAFHYLVKPMAMGELHRVLDEAMPLLAGKTDRLESGNTFTVQKKGEIIRLLTADIWYFEKVGHKIHVVTGGGAIDYYGNFTMLIGQLQPGNFLQCHQGYIVNLDKVRAYRDRTLLLEGDRHVPVSRSFADKTRDALANRLFDRKAAL